MACPRCDGVKWISHAPGYGAKVHPMPERLLQARLDDELSEADAEEYRRIYDLQVQAQEAMFPCPECNYRQFALWKGGHLDSDHDRHRCDEPACQQMAKGTRRG